MMKNIPYEVKRAIYYLNQMGYEVDIHSYKPGNSILYQIVKLRKSSGVIPITPYLTRKELEIWCKGFNTYPTIEDGENPII